MQKQPAETYKVILGSCTISNCGNVIQSRGKSELLRLRDGKDLKLLADCTVKNSNGNTIIKVANNKPVFISETLHYEELENGLIVKDKETGKVYLEFRQLGPREVKVNGIFFINGVQITATDEFLGVGSNRLSNCTFDNCGSALGV
jgi:hypothetical protein